MISRSDWEPLPKPTLSPFERGYLSLCRFFTAAVWCVPALQVPLVHSLINHFRKKTEDCVWRATLCRVSWVLVCDKSQVRESAKKNKKCGISRTHSHTQQSAHSTLHRYHGIFSTFSTHDSRQMNNAMSTQQKCTVGDERRRPPWPCRSAPLWRGTIYSIY